MRQLQLQVDTNKTPVPETSLHSAVQRRSVLKHTQRLTTSSSRGQLPWPNHKPYRCTDICNELFYYNRILPE